MMCVETAVNSWWIVLMETTEMQSNPDNVLISSTTTACLNVFYVLFLRMQWFFCCCFFSLVLKTYLVCKMSHFFSFSLSVCVPRYVEDCRKGTNIYWELVLARHCVCVCVCVCVCAQSFSCAWLFVISCTVAHQAPLSMGFFRQEYWNGLPFPPQGIFPTQESKPCFLGLLHCRQIF